MPVNIEIKGNLAKLLATENLIIEHKAVDTASFDIDRRVLTLPQWETDSNYVYDMLVAHEVGHALHTPLRYWNKEDKYKDLPMDYVNVVEDARIEKLMKQRFAGLNKDFYKAYEELHANNFFDVDDESVNDLKLIDKINLYFKIGAYLCIDFNDEENQIITEIAQAETFDQVLDLSLRLYNLSKQQKQEIDLLELQSVKFDPDGEPMEILGTPQNTTEEETEDEDSTEIEGKGNTPLPTDDEVDEDDTPELSEKAGNHANIDQSDTQRTFDRNVKEELKSSDYRETNYVTIPEIDTDSVLIKFETVRDALKSHFSYKTTEVFHPLEVSNYNARLDRAIAQFNKVKQSSRKDVNNLVKEFEMKKSADSYARTATARTGMLDMTKLHTYKFNDDIFKKVTVIPEGKNHGLVFLLDWSGSMHNIMEDTIKQLFNLVWFCRKVQIPFEVYAFTNDSWSLDPRTKGQDPYAYTYQRDLPQHHTPQLNDIVIPDTFRMVNILSSQQRGRDLDEMMKLLYLQVSALSSYGELNYLREFQLSGTPLNEAIICVGQLTKQIIKSTGIQKCHVVVLTDGDGFHCDYVRKTYDDGMKSKGTIYSGGFMIRQGSKTYSAGNGHCDLTTALVKAVKAELPNTSFLGIRIIDRDYRHFYMGYGRQSYVLFDDMKAQNRKEGMIHFKSDSFDQWYGISSNKLHDDAELTVDQGADKRAISTAFKKMNRGKKTNKVMVKQFIDQIA